MKLLCTLFVVALVSVSATAFAEDPPANQPGPEQKALEMWLGNWSGSGEVKPGPFGPGGSMKWTEECAWFAGSQFHVVCKSKGTSPTGEPTQGIGIVGYNAGKKVYTHYGVDSSGWSGYAEGSRSGNEWTFHSAETIDGKTYQSRFMMNVTSPTEITFTWEMSEDGKTWTTMMDGTSKKM